MHAEGKKLNNNTITISATMKFKEYNASVKSGCCSNSPFGKETDSFVLDTAGAEKTKARTRDNAADETGEAKAQALLNKLHQVCRDLFLPVNYPDSVAEGYLEYQVYDSIQGLSTYLRGVVSTSAVLTATGVGDAEATAMSAAMTWAIRDGFGMIGGLIFSYIASPYFDAHVKEFRLLADVFNDIGLTLDLALPLLLAQMKQPWMSALSNYLPPPYLILTSLSTLCKVACGICAGATKGNITDHFANSGNRADVNAKENTQETLVSLLGMVLGVGLAKWLHFLEKKNDITVQDDILMTDVQLISWIIFLILTVIHIWANYVGIQRLQLRTLNAARAKILLKQVVENGCNWVIRKDTDGDEKEKILTIDKCRSSFNSPSQINESLWVSLLEMLREGDIRLGIRLRDLAKITNNYRKNKWITSTWQNYIHSFGHEKYIILFDEKSNRTTVSVLMKVGATDMDEFKAFIHAHIFNQCIERESGLSLQRLVSRSHEITECLFEKGDNRIDLHSILSNKGWQMSRLYLGFSPWRCKIAEKDE